MEVLHSVREWAEHESGLSYSFTAFGYESGKSRNCVSIRHNSGNTSIPLFVPKRGGRVWRGGGEMTRGTLEQKKLTRDGIRRHC